MECDCCGEQFRQTKRTQRFCSLACSRKWWYQHECDKTSIVCVNCGKTFTPKRADRTTYCSRECAYEHNARKCKKCGAQVGASNGSIYCESCNAERLMSKTYKYTCKKCNKEFITKTIGKKYCAQCVDASKNAKEQRKLLLKTCKECGRPFHPTNLLELFCSETCRKKINHRRNEVHRRHRLRENGNIDYSISIKSIMDRDGDKCHICGEPCDCRDYIFTSAGHFVAGSNYPSIDHLVPVSKGGTHTKGNVKVAHRRCNSLKRDSLCYGGMGKQMQLSM